MILDERLEFCDNTALNTGAAGNYLIGDVVDLQSAGRDLGNGESLYLVAVMTVTATSGGAATLNIQLVTDDNASLSSPAVLLDSGAKALASLTAGSAVMMVELPISGSYERYIGIRQVTGTAAFTAGNIDVFLTKEPTAWRAYADAVN